MKISLDWLQNFVTLTVTDPQEIARRVTAGVAEVDEVEEQGKLLGHCCVGKVLSVAKHPNADRLSFCEVQTDDGVKRVVCGGTNLRQGMCVAFAHVGARVRWHGEEMMTLERTKIRGVESEGMICASAELDLTSRFPAKSEHEIIDLGNGEEGVGESLTTFLNIGDTVLHIDNHAITHRADLFSHVGFAREFVALGLATWKKPAKKPALKFPKAELPFHCIVDRKDLIPRYCSCFLSMDSLGETPRWMRKRLEATGWRCVSLPVDITNYVAMETGMPLHSFDADDIRGDVHMGTATQGETITTLDEVERVLPEGAIVLRDRDGIFDLLGIMGGLRSSTKETTKHIYLHAAIVDPVSIRRAIIATGHRTDASTVYEKGIPREAAMRGLLRALELFLELVPGAALTSKLEEWGDEGKAKPIRLDLDQVGKILGTEIPEKKIATIFEDLEFTAKRTEDRGQRSGRKSLSTVRSSLSVTPPLHRLGDIRGPHDLIEEIGRIAGYNEIPATLPVASIAPPRRDMRLHRVRDALKENGFTELVPLCLLSEALLRKAGLDPAAAVEIRNPIGEDLKLLHTSVLPGLLEHAQKNLLNAREHVATFSCARVFSRGGEAPTERTELGVLLADLHDRTGSRALLEEPFLLLKTTVEQTLHALGYALDVAVAGAVPPYAHPGRFAELHVRPVSRSDGASQPYARIGTIFEVHPSVAARFDLTHRTAAALIDVAALLALVPAVAIAAPVPQYPAVSYGVTETVRMTQSVGDLLRELRGSHEYLEAVSVKDLYRGADAGRDSYNLTLTFTYRAPDRTLTEDEAKAVHAKVLQKIPG